MGNSNTKEGIHTEKYAAQLEVKDVNETFKRLQISKDQMGKKYFDLFASIDKDGSGTIDLGEFHAFFGVERSIFSDQAFSSLENQSLDRQVAFDDFVMNLWNYCTMDEQELKLFMFQIYDDNCTGSLESAQCESLVRMLYNVDELTPELQKVIEKADSNGDGLLSFQEFCDYTKKEKGLLKPGFDLQQKVRTKSFGTSYWEEETKKRNKIFKKDQDINNLNTSSDQTRSSLSNNLEVNFQQQEKKEKVNNVKRKKLTSEDSATSKPLEEESKTAQGDNKEKEISEENKIIAKDEKREEMSKPKDLELFEQRNLLEEHVEYRMILKAKTLNELRLKKAREQNRDPQITTKLIFEMNKIEQRFIKSKNHFQEKWEKDHLEAIEKVRQQQLEEHLKRIEIPLLKKKLKDDAKKIKYHFREVLRFPEPSDEEAFEQAKDKYLEQKVGEIVEQVKEEYDQEDKLRLKETQWIIESTTFNFHLISEEEFNEYLISLLPKVSPIKEKQKSKRHFTIGFGNNQVLPVEFSTQRLDELEEPTKQNINSSSIDTKYTYVEKNSTITTSSTIYNENKWTTVLDEASGYYYYLSSTGESSWEKPVEYQETDK